MVLLQSVELLLVFNQLLFLCVISPHKINTGSWCFYLKILVNVWTYNRPKYNYSRDGNGAYKFEEVKAKILYLLTNEGLQKSVSVSEDDEELLVGLIPDSTNFYAEQGGQVSFSSVCVTYLFFDLERFVLYKRLLSIKWKFKSI